MDILRLFERQINNTVRANSSPVVVVSPQTAAYFSKQTYIDRVERASRANEQNPISNRNAKKCKWFFNLWSELHEYDGGPPPLLLLPVLGQGHWFLVLVSLNSLKGTTHSQLGMADSWRTQKSGADPWKATKLNEHLPFWIHALGFATLEPGKPLTMLDVQ